MRDQCCAAPAASIAPSVRAPPSTRYTLRQQAIRRLPIRPISTQNMLKQPTISSPL